MLRFTFPYLFFISLVALGSGVLNSYNRFGVPAFNQILLNVVMIIAAGFVAPYFPKPGLVLALGVFVAGFVQLVAQFPALHKLGLLPRPRWDWAHEGVRRIARLMLPGIFGSSVAQVSLLLDTLIASFLTAGSISWMYYADRLVEFPMGVFSIALATVILPGLSSHHASESPEEFNTTLDWALRLTVVVATPAAVALLMLSGPLMATLFGYGAFNARDVLMSSYALMAYSLGLMGFSLVKVLAPGYFARQDTKTPVKVGMIALSINMAFNLGVVVPANLNGFPVPHALLALSTGLSAIVNATLLYRGTAPAGRLHAFRALAAVAAAGAVRERRDGGLPVVDHRRLVGVVRLAGDAKGPAARALRQRRRRGLFPGAVARWRAPARPQDTIIRAGPGRRSQAMLITRGFDSVRTAGRGCVVAIGNFDGLHLGHQAILAMLAERSREEAAAGRGPDLRAASARVLRAAGAAGAIDAPAGQGGIARGRGRLEDTCAALRRGLERMGRRDIHRAGAGSRHGSEAGRDRHGISFRTRSRRRRGALARRRRAAGF